MLEDHAQGVGKSERGCAAIRGGLHPVCTTLPGPTRRSYRSRTRSRVRSSRSGTTSPARRARTSGRKGDLIGALSAEFRCTLAAAFDGHCFIAFPDGRCGSIDNTATIAALKKAIATLEKGCGGAFRQTHGATVLKRMLQLDSPMMGNLMDADRDDLAGFLAAPAHGKEHAPQTGRSLGS